MAIFTLAEMTTPLSPDEVKASIYNVLAIIGVNTTAWKPGAVVRTMIAACAIVIAALSSLMAEIAKSGWLELAEGNWLKLVAIYVFGIDPTVLEPTFATGIETLSNTGGGVFGPFAAYEVTFKNSVTGKTYRNTGAFSLAALQTGLPVPIVATEAGSGSNAAPGGINSIESPAMNGVVVSNAAAVVGRDAKEDPEIRLLCLEKRASLSPNGPRDAYAYFARTAKRIDGSLVGVTRVAVSKYSTTGNVIVTVANAAGGISGVVTDPSTDLGAVDLSIRQNVIPDGVTETTQSATAVAVPITYEVWVNSSVNMSPQELQDAIVARLTSFMTTQPIGGVLIGIPPGKLYVDAILTAIEATRPEILHAVVTSPPADVTLLPTDVALLGAVTCTDVHLVVT